MKCPSCALEIACRTPLACPGCGNLLTRPKRGDGLAGPLLAITAAFLLLGVLGFIIGLAVLLKRGVEGNTTGYDEARVEDKNFAYRMPGEPWVRDPETQTALGATAFALRREGEPVAWVALSVSDFEHRSPMVHEMKDRMAEQLHRVFANLPPELPTEPATWAGHEALKCQFRGEHRTTGAVCLGEGFAMHYKGVAYWFYAWAAERDVAAVGTELDELRECFRTLDRREAWSPRVGTEIVYRSPTGKYKLGTYERIWDRPAGIDPAGEDPKAEMLLRGELKGRSKRDIVPRAMLVVMNIDRPGDVVESAREYVHARHTLDAAVYGPTQIVEQSGEPVGDAPIGPDSTLTSTFRLKVSRGGPKASRVSEKLVVYSAIRVEDRVIVAEASCPWSEREIWERRLIQIVGSLRP